MLQRHSNLRGVFARLILAALLCAPVAASARNTDNWDDNAAGLSLAWLTGVNWGGTNPSSGDDIQFGNLSNTAVLGAILFGGDYDYNSFTFTSASSSVSFSISGGTKLTLESSFTNSSTGTITFNPNLVLGSTFTSFNGPTTGSTTLSLLGNLTSAGGFAINQNFNLVLSGTPSIAGTVTVGSSASLTFSETNDPTLSTTIVNNGSVIFGTSSANSFTYSGAMSGTGAVTVAGSLTMSGTGNSYSGTTTVNGGGALMDTSSGASFSPNSAIDLLGTGTLKVNHDESIASLEDSGGTSAGTTIEGGATLKVTGASTVARGIAGAGGFIFDGGTSTFTLLGDFNLSGHTTVASGTVQIGNGAALGNVVLNYTTVNGTLAIDPVSTYTLAGTVTGTGNLSIMGGTVTMSGFADYSGTTAVAAGATLQDSGGSNFSGASAVSLGSGSTLKALYNEAVGGLNGTSSSGTVSISSSATLHVNGGGTFAGTISGPGTLDINSGSAVQILTGSASESGLSISSGTLQLGDGNENSVAVPTTITDNGTLSLDLKTSYTYAGVISGTGGLTILNTGAIVNLTGNSSYKGATNLASSSELNLLGSFDPTGTITLGSGATVQFLETGGVTVGNAITGAGTVVFGAGGSDAFSYTGSLGGTNSVTINNPTSFAGANSHSGDTTIDSGGSLTDTVSGALSPNSYLRLNAGAGLTTHYDESAAGLTTLGSSTKETTVNVAAGTLTLTGAANIQGYTTVSGSGVLKFNGNTGYSFLGDTLSVSEVDVASGTLSIGNGGTLSGLNLSSNFKVSSGASLVFDIGKYTALTYDSNISGMGTLDFHSGTFTLENSSTLCGPTYVDTNAEVSDAVDATAPGFSPNSDFHLGGYAILDTKNNETIKSLNDDGLRQATVNLASGATLTLGNGGDFSGAVHGFGNLEVSGGTFTYRGTADYSGTTSIDGEAALVVTGQGSGLTATTQIYDNGTLTFSQSQDATLLAPISGEGSLNLSGGYKLTLSSGGSASYTGATTVTGGSTLTDGAASSFSPNSKVSLDATSKLYASYSETIAGLSGSGAAYLTSGTTLTIDGSEGCTLTYSGVISGDGALKIDGSSPELLAAANTYTGGTEIGGNVIVDNSSGSGLGSGYIELCGEGQLTIGNNDQYGSVAGDIKVDGTLNFNRTDPIATPFTFGNNLTGYGMVVFNGTGAVAVTNSNSYSGGTTINAGVVIASSSQGSALGTGSIDVEGGTLEGFGYLPNTVALANGATISAVNKVAPTTLTMDALTFSGGSVINVSMSDTAGGGAGSSWSLLSVNNTLTINATSDAPVTVTLTSLTGTNTYGLLSDFSTSSTYQWTIATAAGGISGFSSDLFTVNTSNFLNNLAGGTFSVTADQNDLFLNFTPVPEPSTWALMILGTGMMGWMGVRARRSRA